MTRSLVHLTPPERRELRTAMHQYIARIQAQRLTLRDASDLRAIDDALEAAQSAQRKL